jgi:hypothetical protein
LEDPNKTQRLLKTTGKRKESQRKKKKKKKKNPKKVAKVNLVEARSSSKSLDSRGGETAI